MPIVRNNNLLGKDLNEKSAGSMNSSAADMMQQSAIEKQLDSFQTDLSQKVQHMRITQQGPFRIRANSDEMHLG